jgi:DNA polymerase I-like protein with 3'-5' exonuclease and polymerase domains
LSLSEELFGTKDLRELSKVVLLSFIYGMSDEGIRFLIKDYFNGTDEGKNQKLSEFFLKFSALIPYRKKLEDLFLTENKISSVEGNYRYGTTDQKPNAENSNMRWILSQRIQGTASFILKNAILASSSDHQIKFMFPMHDAALFQVPTERLDSKTDFIKQCFKASFLAVCPEITPKVNLKQFHK